MSEANGASMRVALTSPAWPVGQAPNGIVTHVGHLFDALRRRGDRPYVLAFRADAPLDAAEACDLRRMGATGLWGRARGALERRMSASSAVRKQFVRAMCASCRRLRREPGEFALDTEETNGWARWVAESGVFPVIVRLHGPWFLNGPIVGAEPGAAFDERLRLEREAIVAAHGVLSPSHDVLQRTREFYGLALEGAEVITYAMPLAPERDRWSLRDSEPGSILFIGRFDGHKGADVMLDAFDQVAQKDSRARLTFVGPDRGLRDGAGRVWRFEEYASERLSAPARERLRWLGPQPAAALPGLRKRARMTVVPSRYETLGYTALETAAQGAPLIVADSGGLREVVEHRRNGLRFEMGNAEALAAALREVILDDALAERLGAQALRDCAAGFDPDRLAARTVAYYRLAARGNGRTGPGREGR